MSKANVMIKISIMLGMFAAVLLMVLILPSFVASAEAGDVPVAGITLNKTSSSLYTTQREQLVATVTPTGATNKQIIWTSSDTNVVTVSSSGTVTGVNFGQATVTATAADGSGVYATCSYMVNPYMENLTFPSLNQDARRVQFQFRTGSDISMVYMHVGNRTYYINRPTANTPYDAMVNGDHVKVSISYDYQTQRTVWSVQIALTPTPVGTTETIYFEMFNGSCMAKSYGQTGFVFWEAKVMIGAYHAIDAFQELGFPSNSDCHYKIVDYFDHDEVHFTNANYFDLGTGTVVLQMKLIPSHPIGDLIYKMAFIIRIGDVTGAGNIGDGAYTIDDVYNVLSVSSGSSTYDTMVFYFAADIDGDNSITNNDVLLLLTAVSQNVDVTQRYYCGAAYLPIYYTESVFFE